jgi:hypothetical protein
MKTLSTLVSTILFSSSVFAACPFGGMYYYELKDDARFSVSPEVPAKISRDLFWANYDFFKDFTKYQCRGAYKSADVTHLETGDIFTYYRTIEDACDGGNSVGVIVPKGRHKAIAEISDSEIYCE